MGEAKRRKDSDPLYGKVPKTQQGIIISRPTTIKQDGSLRIEGEIDPIELRRSILFWDKLTLPTNNMINFETSLEEDFLLRCGMLKKHHIIVKNVSGPFEKIYAGCHLKAFSELEEREPGLWAMSEGENSFNYETGLGFKQGRGALVTLHRAIPLPEYDIPLEDLLNFKEKRRTELKSLKFELDNLYSRLSRSTDIAYELNSAVEEIDQKCADVIAVGRESKLKFSQSDFSFGLSPLKLDLMKITSATYAGAKIFETQFDLPVIGALIGAAVTAPSLSLNLDLGGKLRRHEANKKLASSPYRIVSRLINEPI